MRLVGQEKCLLVVRDCSGTLDVFLEDILSLGNTLKASRSKRQLVAEKVGTAPLIAFDEAQRLLVIYVHKNVCMFIEIIICLTNIQARIKRSCTSLHLTSSMDS